MLRSCVGFQRRKNSQPVAFNRKEVLKSLFLNSHSMCLVLAKAKTKNFPNVPRICDQIFFMKKLMLNSW